MALSKVCTLYRFPRELRDAIYELTVKGHQGPLVWRCGQPITYLSSPPLEIALIPDKELYREALGARLKHSTLIIGYEVYFDSNMSDIKKLSKLARRSIRSVVLEIPEYFETAIVERFYGLEKLYQIQDHELHEIAARMLPGMILPAIICLSELRSLTLQFVQDEMVLHSGQSEMFQDFAAFVTHMAEFCVLSRWLKRLPRLTSFELKVYSRWPDHWLDFVNSCECPCNGNPQCPNIWRPSWILKGIDSLFDVEGVEVEDSKLRYKYAQPENITRTWRSKNGQKLLKDLPSHGHDS